MGEHKGWRIVADPRRGTWRGFVRVGGKDRSKSWPSEKEARAWAKGEAAGVISGRPSAAMQAPAQALVSALMPAYLAGMDARGRSASHQANVRRTLLGLGRVAPDLAAAGAGLRIEAWLDQAGVEHDERVGPATRNRRLVEVRALCRWAMRRDLLAKDPTRAIDRASVPDALRPQFSVAELRELLAMPTPGRPCMHRRVAVLAYLGLRADEAAALSWGDLDLAGGVALIRAHVGHRLKRGRERVVPIPGELAAILGKPGRAGDEVAPMANGNLRRDFPQYLEACGLPVAGRSQHSLRHTYAGIMTATGLPGALLSAYLGHTSAATTMLYTRLASRHVQAVEGWPRGGWRLWDPAP
jgi:integrase/recombinase XerD